MLDLCTAAVERCLAAGAQQAEAFAMHRHSRAVEVRDGELEARLDTQVRGIAVRAISNGALAFGYTTDASADGLAELAQRVMGNAAAADRFADRGLPVSPAEVVARAPVIFDPQVQWLSHEDRLSFARRLEQSARAADPRIRNTSLSRCSDAVATYALAASSGRTFSYRTTAASLVLSVIASEGPATQRGYASQTARFLDDLDPEDIGARAAWRGTVSLGGAPVPTQRGTVILAPEVVAELASNLCQALSADAVLKGRSFLTDRIGQAVASPALSLVDEPTLDRAMAATPFDHEGAPAESAALIDGGVLRRYLHTWDTAVRTGLPGGGNATRTSFRTPPDPGASNLLILGGRRSHQALLADVKSGLFVTASRNVGGINPATGDYSVGASGAWINDGQIGPPVANVTIAVPLDELLANIAEVSSDARWISGQTAVLAPTLRIDGVTIGGR
ncbi:MAG: TldD/PmbA family protein [Chloroflexota bacterium]